MSDAPAKCRARWLTVGRSAPSRHVKASLHASFAAAASYIPVRCSAVIIVKEVPHVTPGATQPDATLSRA